MTRRQRRELERERERQAEAERSRGAQAEAESARRAQAEAERARQVQAEAERARRAQAEAERARRAQAEAEDLARLTAPTVKVSPPSYEPSTATGAQRAIGAALGRPRPRGVAAVGLAVLAVLAVVLVPLGLAQRGLFSSGPASASVGSGTVTLPTADANAPIREVLDVVGRLGSVPVVSLLAVAAPPADVLTDVLVEGEGRTVSTGDAVLLSVSVFNGTDGTNTTGNAAGARLYRGVLDPSQVGDVLATSVEGATEGTRLVLRAPVEAADGTFFTEITVVDVLPTSAVGTQRDAPANAPTAVLAEDGTMTVSLNGLPVPTRTSASVLISGDGPQVSSTDTVVARYQTVSWNDGGVRTDSYGWTVLPGTIHMDDTLRGIAEQLVDVTVGSRVILSLPADQARGDEPVAVVIDVLAVVDDDELTDVSDGASGRPEVVRVTPSAQDPSTRK